MPAADSPATRLRARVRAVTKMRVMMRVTTRTAAAIATALGGSAAFAQPPVPVADSGSPIFTYNTPNVHLLSHIPLGRSQTIAGLTMEQELSRPYVYVSRMQDPSTPAGFSLISVKDPAHAKLLYTYHIANPELHQGFGGMEGKTFKYHGRYYYVQAFQFNQGSPDADLGAIVFDVTGLPDTSKIREVGRILAPNSAVSLGTPAQCGGRQGCSLPGGFHNVFPYRHSDGRVIMFATTLTGTYASVFDMGKFIAGDPNKGFIGHVPVPGATGRYHDFVVQYDPITHQDKFYGGAQPGGYFVFDVSKPETPKLLTSVTVEPGAVYSSFGRGHTITPTPDGRYIVTESEFQYAPLRIFDLKPGLDGTVPTISQSIGAWTANWKHLPHNHEIRWPYVFVSAYEDGLQVFNMLDPTNPITVGFYRTYDGPTMSGVTQVARPDSAEISQRKGTGSVLNGAWGIAVRNADGLVVISDMTTGFWALHMDGFDGWNGHDWGMPNVSTAQNWETGPEGVPHPVLDKPVATAAVTKAAHGARSGAH
jgi:hypothetical protein